MKPLDPEHVPLAGTTVIEASAGTGKTYTITSLFLRLLLERRLPVGQILVVTYTRAATAELRQRIRARLGEALRFVQGDQSDDSLVTFLCQRFGQQHGENLLRETLERAMGSIDEAPVFTIHGFCQRTLNELAFESGTRFGLELTTSSTPILAEIADDYFTRELHAAPALKARALLQEPDKLRTLAARAGSGDALRVLPERIEVSEFDRAAWDQAYARCRELWAGERANVVELVRASDKSSRYVDDWQAQWTSALEVGSPGCMGLCSEPGRQAFSRSGARERVRKGARPPEHPFLDAAEELLAHEQAYAQRLEGEKLQFRRGFVDYLRTDLERRGRETEVRTFDALLTELDRALGSAQGPALVRALRQRYGAALVDEFQDTDPLQYRIFRGIFGANDTPLFLIGDPKQAIYGFRGADVHAYLAARNDAGERVYTLETNRRSDPCLIDALNRFYATVKEPFALADIHYQPVNAPRGTPDRLEARDGCAPVDVLLLDELNQVDGARNAVTEAVARDIARLLCGGAMLRTPAGNLEAVKPKDVAVLCRTNRQALAIQLALSQLNVPAVFQGDESVFQSDDAIEIERVLRALANPSDAGAIRTFLSSWYGGLDAHELLALEDDDAKWDDHRACMQRLHETWLRHGFMQAMRALIVDYQVEARLLARPDGTRRITNLWHLVELLAGAAIHQRLGPLGLLRWFQIVRQDEARRAELVGEDHELRLESGEDAIKLTTIHKSKGLEYPVVYCPFLWESADLRASDKEFPRFHDPELAHALTLDLGSEDKAEHLALAGQEALAEALRLLYVALTRAKHRICIPLPNNKNLGKSALGYVLFGGGDARELQKRVSQLAPEAREQQLTELCSALTGSWSLRRLVADAPLARYQPRVEPARDLRARPVKRALDRSIKVSSFSALVAERPASHVDAAVDHDALTTDGEEQAVPASSLILDDFPRGAAAGQLIHEVLENVDFAANRPELEQAVSQILAARAYAAELGPKLAAGLHGALNTPLDQRGVTLAQVRREARLHEMEFVIPVSRTLTPRALERAFREQRAPEAHPEYGSELRDLGFDALKGLLRGFVDLVFVHEGRFYVVDYKSNRLGPQASDYGQRGLVEAMREHHYFLQYHLYCLALQRYLKLRKPGYDHATHFGGVFYLFLRGMSPEHPLGTGVFFDRPSAALLAALDAAFGDAVLEPGEPA